MDEQNIDELNSGQPFAMRPDPSCSDSSSPPNLSANETDLAVRPKAELSSAHSSANTIAIYKQYPIHLDHIELKNTFKHHQKQKNQPLPPEFSKFFNKAEISFGPHSASIGGPYHASTHGRRILNSHFGRDTEKYDKRKSGVPLHNQLLPNEREEIHKLGGDEPYVWAIKRYVDVLRDVRLWAYYKYHPSFDKLDFSEELYDPNGYSSGFYHPLTCPEIEFYREYPIPSDIDKFFSCLGTAISKSFGDLYETEKREKYSRRWLIKGLSGQQGKFIWIKCYRKRNYFRLEVQIRNPKLIAIEDCECFSLERELLDIGRFATEILNKIHDNLAYSFPALDIGKLESVLYTIFKRAYDSKKFQTFIKCISECYAYTPKDHKKAERLSSQYHIKKMLQSGLLERHPLFRFDSQKRCLRRTTKYFYTLSQNWMDVAVQISDKSKSEGT